MTKIELLQEAIINVYKSEEGVKPRWLYSNPGWNQLEWLEETFRVITTPLEVLQQENKSWFEENFNASQDEDALWMIQSDLEK